MRDHFTAADLIEILRAAAGELDGVVVDSSLLDVRFDELGYDSLALLETGSRIERAFGIRLHDSVVAEATTPRELLDAVNATLATLATDSVA
jgi:act minimal PKS acyl carrier protein